MKQGHDSISAYYTKMKISWDQIDGVDPLPVCSCTNFTCTNRGKAD